MKSYYQWHRRTLLGRFCVWVMACMVMALQCLPGYFAITYADVPPGEEEDATQVAQANTTDSSADSTTVSTSSAEDGEVEGEVEEGGGSQPLPPALLTLGVRAGEEGLFEGVGDILLPIWFTGDNGLLFVSPRASFTDNDEQEYNIGIGFRQHVVCRHDREAIIGANVFYDSRYSANDNQFDQVGFGAEFLTKNVDARFNYYLPDDKKEVIDEFTRETSTSSTSSSSSSKITKTGAVTPEGHKFVQDVTVKTTTRTTTTTTTTRFHFKRFEAALEGWDAEIGVIIPGTEDIAETRVFIGYQSFDNPFGGDDYEGLKGRIEIRALPGVFLDGEWFEADELNGTDFFVGARVQVPVDLVNLVNGKNPFEGAGDNFKKSKESTLLDRIAREQVIRDPRVQTVESEAVLQEDMTETIVSKSTKTKTTEDDTEVTILNDIEFTASDNEGGAIEDGTFENPWGTFDEARAASVSEGTSIYVFDNGLTYTASGTHAMPDGTVLLGSGKAVVGLGGVSYTAPAATHPTIRGPGDAPIVEMGEDTTVGGLRLTNPGGMPAPVLLTGGSGNSYNVARTAIIADGKSGLTIMDNLFDDVNYAIVLVDTLSGSSDAFEAMIMGNELQSLGAIHGGIVIDTVGASGEFDVEIIDNDFSGTGGDGLLVRAKDYDRSELYIENLTVNGNLGDGADLELDGNTETMLLTVISAAAGYNSDNGFELGGLHAEEDATVIFRNISASFNKNYGFEFEDEGVYAGTGLAYLSFSNITANYNTTGIYIDREAVYSRAGDAILALDEVEASYNSNYGFYIAREGAYGGGGYATVTASNITMSYNVSSGFHSDNELAHAMGSGDDAFVSISGAVFSFNGGDGLYIDDDVAEADAGDATVTFYNISASFNAESGIEMDDGAEATGDARFTLMQAELISNSTRGLLQNFGGSNRQLAHSSSGGVAIASLSNITAQMNGQQGITLTMGAYAEGGGDASFYLTDSSFTGNGSTGFGVISDLAKAVGGGDATVFIDPVSASYNGGYGIYVGGYGAFAAGGGDAYFTMDVVTASYNAYSGIYVTRSLAYATAGHASTYLTYLTVISNSGYGFYVGGYGARAYGMDHDAYLHMDEIVALRNSTHGVSIGHDVARSEYGDATVTMYDMTASYNGGYGFYFQEDIAYAQYGSAYATLMRIEAISNSDSGFYMANGAYAKDSTNPDVGDAIFVMRDGVFYDNGEYGIMVYDSFAESRSTNGMTKASLFNITASFNGEGGIYTDYGAYGYGTYVSFRMENIEAISNSGHGIYFDNSLAQVKSSSGTAPVFDQDASVVLMGITSSFNDGYGLHIGDQGAYTAEDAGASGDATFVMMDAVFYGNEDSGLYVDEGLAFTRYGDSTVYMDHITSSFNDGYGFYIGEYFAYSRYGNASAYIVDLSAISNTDGGLYTDFGARADDSTLFGRGLTATFSLRDSVFYDNGGYGMYFYTAGALARGTGGVARATFTNITSSFNGDGGFYAQYGAYGYGVYTVLRMTDFQAISNGAHGIYFNTAAAYAVRQNEAHPDTMGSFAAFINISASENEGHGLYLGEYGATTEHNAADKLEGHGGDAVFVLMDSTFYGNAEDGIYVGAAFAHNEGYGDATVSIDAVTASYNAAYGVYVEGYLALSEYGNADVSIDELFAITNTEAGLYVASHGAYSDATTSYVMGVGSATFTMRDSVFYDNGTHGLYFAESVAHSTATGGATIARFENVTASYNGDYGFYAEYGVYGYGFLTSFSMDDFHAHYNGDNGINFEAYIAKGESGDEAIAHPMVSASFEGISASHNSGYGFIAASEGVVASGRGDASFTLNNSTFYANDDSGFFIALYAADTDYGDASVYIDPIVASYNGDYGMYFGGTAAAFTADGNAYVNIDGITATHNGEYGVWFQEYGAYSDAIGDASFYMQNVYLYMNGSAAYDGLYFNQSLAHSGENSAYASLQAITATGFTYGIKLNSHGAYANSTNQTGDVMAVFTIGGYVVGNSEDGVYIGGHGAYAVRQGDAKAFVIGLTASQNGGNGLYFNGYGAYANGAGSRADTALLIMDDISASYNLAGDGIFFGGNAVYSGYGSASGRVSNVEALANSGYGLRLDGSGAKSSLGDAYFSVGGNFSGNGEDGFYVNGTGAKAASVGNATMALRNFTASQNGGYGVYFNNDAAYAGGFRGDATFIMDSVSVSSNTGGSGAYIYGYGALALMGSATTTFSNVHASYNAGSGIEFDNAVSYGGDGDALFSLVNSTLSLNGADGLHVSDPAAHSMGYSATVIIDSVSASHNIGEGMRFTSSGALVEGGSGTAAFYLDNVTVSKNGSFGLYFGFDVAASVGAATGNAYAHLDGISAAGNGDYGFFAGQYGAFASGGDASFTLANTTLDGNAPDDGVYFRDTVAYAANGSAYATFDGISVTGKVGYGLFIANYGAYAGGGAGDTAYFALKNSTISGHGIDGVFIGATPAYAVNGADATTIFDPLSISHNGNMGINIRSRAASAYGGGTAYVFFDQVNASGNGDWGININGSAAYADTGNAFSTFQYITTTGNGDSGININGSGAESSGTGFAMVVMRHISSSYNDGRGIHINGEGADSLMGNASARFEYITTSFNEEEGININGEGTYGGGGFATTAFKGISAIQNGEAGININGDGAEAFNGDANFSFLNSTVSFNGLTTTSSGLRINGSAAYAHDGHAYATFDPISASFNSDNGIEIDGYGAVAFGSGNNATLVMDEVSANGNTLNGITITAAGAYSGDGAGAVTLSYVAATGNGDYGFYIGGYGAYSEGAGDSATFTVNHLTASYNGLNGFHVELTAANSVDGGDARTTLSNVTASYNGGYGIYFNDNAAYAGSTGTAALVVSHLTVNDNVSSGFKTEGYAAYANGTGDAIVDFNYFTASNNGEMGIYFGYHAAYAGDGGDSSVILRNGSAISNTDHGIYFYYTASYARDGGNAYGKMENISASYNGIYGIYVTDYFAYANDGSATGVVRNLETSYNGDMGFYAEDNFVHSEGEGHNATAIIDGLSASYNTRWGIAFEDSVAHAISGTARATFANISAGENGEDGFFVGDHGAYAYGYGGDGAYFTMTDSTFYGNGSYGMWFGESVAHGVVTSGHTAARFTNITASYSGEGGFYAGYGAYGYGTYSLLVMDGFFANYNTDSGIYMIYGVDQETATDTLGSYAIFRNMSVSYNGDYGMYFAAYGALVDTAGDGLLSIENSEFNGNTDAGVYFDSAAVHADSGTGAFVLNNVTASDNSGHGIYSDGYGAYGEYGGTLRVTDVTLYSNSGYGMFFEAAGAYGSAGQGYARFYGFTASFNGDDGLYFGGYGAAYSGGSGKTDFHFLDSQSSYNSGYGVYVAGEYAAFSSGGTAQALWRNSVISGNSEGGVYHGGVYSEGGAFGSADIVNTDFAGNGGDGFFARVYADDGAANVTALNSVFADNAGDGLEADVSTGSGSVVINLGRSTGGGGFNKGSNSIFGNGGFGVNNSGSGVGTIENNFWGGGAPAAGTDYDVGGWTAPSTFKGSDPND